MRRVPEILAPAGSPECLPAAVAGGAHAVYLGLRHFNARGRAENFRTDELAHHVAYLHGHGVKCYVVMNTLIHDDEYPKALMLARAAHAAGVDAVIVQDLGLWTILAEQLPGLHRHASTQMTLHDPAQVAVLSRLGAQRVILARELTIDELRACTAEAARHGVETEHFVHGALCYAFSGQCLMSNFAGCRSANRGTCAQNCRFDYRQDGAEDLDTVLSMRDLALVAQVPALAEAGVASFKIEGRLKTPEYVYTVSRVYREAAEAWAAERPYDLVAAKARLREVFARPHTDAPALGIYGEASRLHRWDPLRDAAPDAHLLSYDRASGRALLRAAQVTAGQGFSYTHGLWNGGFLVIAADREAGDRWRCKVRGEASGPPLPRDMPLWRNVDHARRREAQAAMSEVVLPPPPPDAVALTLTVGGVADSPLHVRAETADGRSAALDGPVLQVARGRALDEAQVRESLGAFGGTGFRCATITVTFAGALFVPVSALKQLRRQLVERLVALPVVPATAAPTVLPEPSTPRRRLGGMWVAVGSLAAARAALDAGAAEVWLDDAKLDLWSATAPQLDLGNLPRERLRLRHPATARTSPHLAALGLGVVAGQLGALTAAVAAGLPAIADHPLNCFGLATLRALGQLGAVAAVVSLECSAREVARLAGRLGATSETLPAVGLCVHGRVPAMLTRQDHRLAPGEQRRIRAAAHDGDLPYDLQRRIGGDTVVWEARRLCAPEQAQLTAHLVDGWVLECADLAPAAVAAVVGAYRGLHDGTVEPAALLERIATHAVDGIFPGHLERGSRDLDAAAELAE